MTFSRWLRRPATQRPDHSALEFGARRWSYRALEASARETAARLAALGLRAGDRLALLLPNRPIYVELIHAAMCRDATLVPLNVRLSGAELCAQIEDARPRLLVYDTALAERAKAAVLGSPVRAIDVDTLAATPHAPVRIAESLAPERDHAILFTSGTTGRAKGVRLTYANQFASARASADRLSVFPDDRWLLCMPLYHVGGLAIAIRAAIYGSTVVLRTSFEADDLARTLREQRITQVSLVPTMLARLLDRCPDLEAPAHLRCVLLGGGPIPPALAARARDRGFAVAATYGLTEAASQVATQIPGDPRPPRPLRGIEVRIVDRDGRACVPDEVGEICIRGPQVMAGYLRHTAPFEDGWLHTGDLGSRDRDGGLRVVDRRTDLVVTGGENVYPAEVEAALLQHPEVSEACAVGLSDPEWGQRLEAAIVAVPGARPSEEALRAHCRTLLAGYKIPRAFHLCAELPRTASGKLRRAQLRAELEAKGAAD